MASSIHMKTSSSTTIIRINIQKTSTSLQFFLMSSEKKNGNFIKPTPKPKLTFYCQQLFAKQVKKKNWQEGSSTKTTKFISFTKNRINLLLSPKTRQYKKSTINSKMKMGTYACSINFLINIAIALSLDSNLQLSYQLCRSQHRFGLLTRLLKL